MTSSVVPATGLSLSGAPDTEIGMHKPQHKPLQAFRVELPVALAEELRKHAAGKPNGIQLTCGRSPVRTLWSLTVEAKLVRSHSVE